MHKCHCRNISISKKLKPLGPIRELKENCIHQKLGEYCFTLTITQAKRSVGKQIWFLRK